MKAGWRVVRIIGKWLLLTLVILEVACFFIVTFTNLLVFGQIWEGGLAHYDSYALFLNIKGVQPTAYNPPVSEGRNVKHLWLLGGSTTRGSGVEVGETIASQLALRLNGPESRQPVVVTNYGENSFNSLLETKYLQKLLMETPRPPDVVIFYDGANDCAYFNQYRTPQAHYGYRRLQGPIESYRRSLFGLLKPLNTAFYNSFTLEVYDRLRHGVIPVEPNDPLLGEMLEATSLRYDHVRRLSACYGAEFLLFWQPLLWGETGKVDPKVTEQEKGLAIMGAKFLRTRHNFSVTYQALADRLKDKPYFVDFQNVLCSRNVPVYEADGVHLKPSGNEMVAQAMARVLAERGW